jgi:hypothetical protein
MINNMQLAVSPEAALRPLADLGAGAVLLSGVLAGRRVVDGALPHIPWASLASASKASACGGYQPISRTRFEQQQHVTPMNPATAGGLGPHPVREPEPV